MEESAHLNRRTCSAVHEDFIGQVIDLLQEKLINLITAKKILKNLITDPEKLPREVDRYFLFFFLNNKV